MPQNGNKSIYITDGTTTGTSVGQRPAWQYTKMNENQFQNIARPSLVYLTKIFNLSAGQYTFNFDYKVMGNEGEDYLRVFLLPADMELNGAGSSNFPDGYQNWYYLDNGTQVARTPSNNSPSTAFVSFAGGTNLHNVVEVIPGGAIEPGNYMMVFAWRNTGTTHGLTNNPTQYPAAIDNVSVTWSSLVYPPEVSYEASQATDTEAPPMYLYAPELGIAPTSYEVQYEPALDHNDYEGAPIASFDAIENPQSVTLTGLTPHTLYNVRIRSVYTANGHSVYSDWANYASMFTTKYPRPTNLTVLDQTTSWANVVWTPVEMELPEGQYIHYWWQLTTDLNDWGDYIGQGLVSYSWEQNLAPGTYYFHAKTAVYENNVVLMGESNWSEPNTITIAPWTDPVTVFPLIENFEEFPDHFANGLTLDGEYEHLDVLGYLVSGVPTPEGGENDYMLRFHSCSSKTAYLVLPPMRPSASDALVSFWWYHDNSDNNANEGVTVEHSSDGSTWTTWGNKITRYAEETGWVKYQQVIPASGTDPVYIRLRFDGSNSNDWTRCCYLDDLTVNTFQSQQPYISYVDCDANTATITLYDYAYDNGWPSSDFQVQYRKVGNEWSDNSIVTIANTEPAFQKYLTVENLDPNTYYEFRARARVSIGNTPLAWSNYSESYRQWTSNGVFTVSPGHSFEMDFEYGAYNWTLDPETDRWDVQHDGACQGSYCAYCPGSTSLNDQAYLTSPEINFSGCNNVILRFWSKGKGVDDDHGDIYTPLTASDDWTKVELSLSYFMNKGPIKVCFYRKSNNTTAWYVDDISIIANAYGKIFDCKWNEVGLLSSGGNWYPQGVPSATDEVMIMRGSQVYYSNSPFSCGTINFGTTGSVWVRANCMLTVTTFNATNRLTVDGTAYITTLNPGEANSVVVNNGGVLNVTTINGEDVTYSPKVVIKDGGQVKSANPFFATIEKNITGYGASNVNERTGWNLIATPTAKSVNQVLVPMSGEEFLFSSTRWMCIGLTKAKNWNGSTPKMKWGMVLYTDWLLLCLKKVISMPAKKTQRSNLRPIWATIVSLPPRQLKSALWITRLMPTFRAGTSSVILLLAMRTWWMMKMWVCRSTG